MRDRFVQILPIGLCLLSESLFAGLSGSAELRWQTDSSRFQNTEHTLEQWTAINYQDLASGFSSNLQFSLKVDEGTTQGRLYQCYLRSGDGEVRPELTLGRFETVNSDGYQTLDGFTWRQRHDAFGWRVMAGKLKRFEDYAIDATDLMLGVSGDYDLLGVFAMPAFERVRLDLGLEHLRGTSPQTRLHGGVSGLFKENQTRFFLSEFHLAGDVNTDDGTWHRISADSRFDLHRLGVLGLRYAYYDPDDELETFRERFHGFYSLERQSVARGLWQLPEMSGLRLQFELSGNRPDAGAEGMGWAAEANYPLPGSHRLDARLDYLKVDKEHAVSLYLRDRAPLSSRMEMAVEGVYQTKQTGLSGDNHLWGVSLEASRMIFKQARLCLSGEWLDHSARDDEYRLGLVLRYDFYQIDTGELP
jgi:hypothetical protein